MKFYRSFLTLLLVLVLPILTANNLVLAMLPIQQPEEGWRWKKSLTVKIDDQEHSFEDVHEHLRKRTLSLSTKIKGLNPAVVFEFMRKEENQTGVVLDLFQNLESHGVTINDVSSNLEMSVTSSSSQMGTLYQALQRTDCKSPLYSYSIQDIVEDNLKRLRQRNIVLAGVSSLEDDSLKHTFLMDIERVRYLAFLSGTGNKIAKLIEYFPDFCHYKFMIFDEENYTGFLKGNLGFILSHDLSRAPENLIFRSAFYQGQVNKHVTSYKSLQDIKKKYNEGYATLEHHFRNLAPLPQGSLSQSSLQTTHDSLLKMAIEVPALLDSTTEIRSKHKESDKFIGDFFHSEQLLRLFLYNNITSLLDSKISTKQAVFLNLHSLNDICEPCAHCLFLESEMSHVDTDVVRPRIKKRGIRGGTCDPYGFFEKFNGEFKKFQSRDDLIYLILASSQQVGSRRGEMHRYQCGHDISHETIDGRTFSPLMAFRNYQDPFELALLPPSLTMSTQAVVPQSYFPTSSEVEKIRELSKKETLHAVVSALLSQQISIPVISSCTGMNESEIELLNRGGSSSSSSSSHNLIDAAIIEIPL